MSKKRVLKQWVLDLIKSDLQLRCKIMFLLGRSESRVIAYAKENDPALLNLNVLQEIVQHTKCMFTDLTESEKTEADKNV